LALIVTVLLISARVGPPALTAQGGDEAVASPAELTELDYLIGEWTVRSFSRQPAAEFVEADFTTSYRARYLYDGLSILAEFYGESREGFYGVHLISRAAAAEFVHHYLNARANRRLEFRGRFEDGDYHLSRDGGYGGGDFLFEEVDSEIQANSFVKRIYQSDDDGATWVEGDYYFRFERVEGSGAK
jgi:hypothetical protein